MIDWNKPHFGLPPGVTHAALAAVPTVIAALAGNAWIGAAFGIGFYAGRERKQAEGYYGNIMIPPWKWMPRAWRDMGWPALTALTIAAVWDIAT